MVTSEACNHSFDTYNTAGRLICAFCSMPMLEHQHIWVREGIGGGTGLHEVLWAEYEHCGCGVARKVGGE